MGKVRPEDKELETGLMDDFDGTIVDVRFEEPRAEYAAISGTSDPVLTLTLESPEMNTPIEQTYSIGAAKQWQVSRGGKEVISAKNPDTHRFNRNCRAGVLVDSLCEVVGSGDKQKGQDALFDRVKNDRYMTEAEFYIGLSCHWLRKPLSTVGGETRDVLMPCAYLGEAPVSGKKTSTPVEVSEEDEQSIIAIALGKNEVGFRSAAIRELKGKNALLNLIINKDLIKKLVDEGKLTVDDGGLYALP